jgi:hypothetical protein
MGIENGKRERTYFAEIEEPIIFPVHPRTRQKMVEFSLNNPSTGLGTSTQSFDPSQDKSAIHNLC